MCEIDAHRAEVNKGIEDARSKLDGSRTAAVSLTTGYSEAELEELGGVPETE